jgi:hypothetical protein
MGHSNVVDESAGAAAMMTVCTVGIGALWRAAARFLAQLLSNG